MLDFKSTGKHIMIVELTSIMELFEKETAAEIILNNDIDETIKKCSLIEENNCFEKINFKTASGDGENLAFKCLCTIYLNPDTTFKVDNMVVCIYNGVIMEECSCKGIIGVKELKCILEGY